MFTVWYNRGNSHQDKLGGEHMSDDKNLNKEQESNQPGQQSRRSFLKNSGLVAGGLIGGSLLGSFIDNPFATDNKVSNNVEDAKKDLTETRMFFTRVEDFNVLEAAVEEFIQKMIMAQVQLV